MKITFKNSQFSPCRLGWRTHRSCSWAWSTAFLGKSSSFSASTSRWVVFPKTSKVRPASVGINFSKSADVDALIFYTAAFYATRQSICVIKTHWTNEIGNNLGHTLFPLFRHDTLFRFRVLTVSCTLKFPLLPTSQLSTFSSQIPLFNFHFSNQIDFRF